MMEVKANVVADIKIWRDVFTGVEYFSTIVIIYIFISKDWKNR